MKLPDHDWVIAARHKLIPSVYAGIIIKPDMMGRPEAVSYSGPTYISIRSGKHSSSTADTHAADLEHLFELEDFKKILLNTDKYAKPVFIVSVDGGPDENPRYEKVIKNAISHFFEHDLDAIFICTNAPGRSAFNRVERRMAPLSRELSGVVLDHEHFGSHLDNNKRTTNPELEKKNFAHAGEILSNIWSQMIIDNFNVYAEYIEPGKQESINCKEITREWYYSHVRESQYLLQVNFIFY